MKFIKRIKDEVSERSIRAMSLKYGISHTLAEILLSRGYNTDEKLKSFLHPTAKDLHSPFLFKDMEKAVSTIKTSIDNNENITVWGDFDCDGSCSTTILALELRRIGANVSCYIPDRHTEGYGLNKEGIDKLKERDCNLIITVDCGITSAEVIAYAYSLGIKVIVTDHHEAPDILPDCEAIIDAKVPGETYPFKELCGAGVAGKLVMALSGQEVLRKYIDLMALATVADLVPLVDENRAIVTGGLVVLNNTPRPGIQGLSQYVKEENQVINTYMLGYKYGPMINACGRLGHASDCVNLLSSNNPEKIQKLSKKLFDYNEERKAIEEELTNQCLDKLDISKKYKSIVLFGDDWEVGVIGIVASRILEIFNCPVIIMSHNKENNTYHGSGRSITGINLYDSLVKCKNYILQFGGHAMAAGLTVEEKNLSTFIEKFDEVMSSYDDTVFDFIKKYDAEIPARAINKQLGKELKIFEPTGLGNPSPTLLLKNISMKEAVEKGVDGKHFSCIIYDETGNSKAIAFNQRKPDHFDDLDVIVSVSIDTFNGIEYPKSQILAYKTSDEKIKRDLINAETIYGIRTKEQPLAILNITDRKIKQFEKAGIFTVQDLINYFPKKYFDFRETKTVKDVCDKELCSIVGKIRNVKKSDKMVWANCTDLAGNNFMACWFHQPYIFNTIFEGQTYNFCGTVKLREKGFVQIYPLYWDKDIDKLKTLIPVYKKIPGMSSDYLNTTMEKALKVITNTDYLEEGIIKDFNLLSEYDTYFYLHKPKSDVQVEIGLRRKVFDSLFKFNFILKDKLNVTNFNTAFPIRTHKIWNEIRKIIPYELTPDQNSSIESMYEYMKTGTRLNGLVQGDVGSGKTIVAFFMMALGIDNGFQSCIIAPTEVLAKQHYKELHEMMQKLGVEVGLLTGSMKVREKRTVLKGLEDGSIQMIVGTHAVLQDSVKFQNLGLVVIDEQHRFGVAQREKLLDTEKIPHVITMSATPIPRTLSMALYGDNIQVYSIKTKPAGRKPVITKKMYSDKEINEFMLEEIKKGHQCYVVCPLIEDSESETMSDVKSVSRVAQDIKDYFKDNPLVKISDISGRMKQDLIAAEIDKFTNKESNILISTTIIEVGVNVPNATVMVIKSSERFGLAQAHQLRGRVGRGQHQSYCLLQTNKDDRKAEILCSTNDGFEIAKQDMLLRGSGDFIGTQQTGYNKEVMLMIAEPDLYKRISVLNDNIFADPAKFARYSYILEETKQENK